MAIFKKIIQAYTRYYPVIFFHNNAIKITENKWFGKLLFQEIINNFFRPKMLAFLFSFPPGVSSHSLIKSTNQVKQKLLLKQQGTPGGNN